MKHSEDARETWRLEGLHFDYFRKYGKAAELVPIGGNLLTTLAKKKLRSCDL